MAKLCLIKVGVYIIFRYIAIFWDFIQYTMFYITELYYNPTKAILLLDVKKNHLVERLKSLEEIGLLQLLHWQRFYLSISIQKFLEYQTLTVNEVETALLRKAGP